MQIRKGLLAAATAATVSIAGISVPAFAEEKATAPTETKSAEQIAAEADLLKAKNEEERLKLEREKFEAEQAEKDRKEQEKKDRENATTGDKIKRQFTEGSTDSKGQVDPKAITAWIAVFTAILGAIGTAITFAQKNFNIKF